MYYTLPAIKTISDLCKPYLSSFLTDDSNAITSNNSNNNNRSDPRRQLIYRHTGGDLRVDWGPQQF